jgi:ParB family transcriptional regulator, chromosome partitioning protein
MALGKSLGNILGNYFGEETLQMTEGGAIKEGNNLMEMEIDSILPNPYQTRVHFDQEQINSLAQNIKANGLIQPIVVLHRRRPKVQINDVIYQIYGGTEEDKTKLNSGDESKAIPKVQEMEDEYMLLAGERRLRACKSLGWTKIPVVIREESELNEKQQTLLSVMENLQREDLSPLETASTFALIMKSQEVNEDDLAKMLNKSTQYIKNHLRILTLSDKVKSMLLKKQLGESHVRHLVGLPAEVQDKLIETVVEQELTVKEIAKLVQDYNTNQKAEQQKQTPKTEENKKVSSKEHKIPEDYLRKIMRAVETIPGSQIKCQGDDKRGKIVISW